MFELRISLKSEVHRGLDDCAAEILRVFEILKIGDVVECLEWVGEEGSAPSPTGNESNASSWSIYRHSLSELNTICDALKKFEIFSNIDFVFRDIGESGWQAVWQAEESSQQVGKFLLVLDKRMPDGYDSSDALIPIIMQSGRSSFGSGQHSTTRACLLALTDIAQTRRPESCLDIGAGNGVLSIAAARLGIGRVVSTEIDDSAIRDAKLNALLNDAHIDFRLGADVPLGDYELIFCNILLPELLRILPDLSRSAKQQALVLLAGFHNADSHRVIGTAEKFGLSLNASYIVNDWPCLVFERQAGL
jgi:ribosomal protein L11 methylase PrmA